MMKPPPNPLVEHIKEVAWAIFMLNVIVFLLVMLVSDFVGSAQAWWLFIILSSIVTAAIGSIAVLNLLVVAVSRRFRRRADRPRSP